MDNQKTIVVWDILVRLFHWSLLVFFVIAYVTAEQEGLWHIYSGYTVLGLIVFRVLWGIIGSKYARFSNFLYSPAKVIQYLKSLIRKNPQHYIGHNPVGGYMTIALLLSLFVVTISGLKLYAVEEGLGPLAGVSSEFSIIKKAYAAKNDDGDNRKGGNKDNKEEEYWEELHELATNFTLFLVFLHILGVVVSSRLHKENLVKSMITGRKKG